MGIGISDFGFAWNSSKSEIRNPQSEIERGAIIIQEGQLINRDPEILGGMPVFMGTRVPIQNLLDYLAEGLPLDDFLDDFPAVSRE